MLVEGVGLFRHTIECSSLVAALHEVKQDTASIGLVMLDLDLPDTQGLETLERMRGAAPSAPILVVSAGFEGAIIDGAFERGARGYVPKNSSGATLRMAVRSVLHGELYVPPHILPVFGGNPGHPSATAAPRGPIRLTSRQNEVLLLLAKGYANKEIASTLSLSLSTVRVHVSAILERLGVENRTQAATSPTAQLLLARHSSA